MVRKISPCPSLSKRGIPPFEKRRLGGIIENGWQHHHVTVKNEYLHVALYRSFVSSIKTVSTPNTPLTTGINALTPTVSVA
jgi:hypothetical protein